MRDGLGRPQSIVVLGGTSELGLAIVEALSSVQLDTVVLGCRELDSGRAAADRLRVTLGRPDLDVDVVAFDVTAVDTHQTFFVDLGSRHGDLDVVVLAAGVLADSDMLRDDPVAAARVADIGFSGPVGALTAAASHLRRQGHGTLVVLSSVAGRRVRARLAVYGAAKAGLDGFAEALGDDLWGSGVDVVVVRPGFVRTKMTRGLPEAPFATDAAAVGAATAEAVRARRRRVFVPWILGPITAVMRLVPAPIWRRIAERA